MSSKSVVFSCLLLALLALIMNSQVGAARYLPTRSNGDRIDKLRELLKDLLENEIEKEELSDASRWRQENKIFYKREAPSLAPGQ